MFGSLVVTAEHDGTRALRFGRTGAAQTVIRPGAPDYLHFAYTRLALAGVALAGQPRRMLVVGLGGGALPTFLRRHFPQAEIDVVDIDPAVLAVAREYFGFREDTRLHAHIADGRAFIEGAPAGHYDLILLDAFGSAEVPAHLATLEFLVATRRALATDGVVVANLWNAIYNRRYAAMLRTYAEAFPEVHVIDTRREVNHVVLALPAARGLDAASISARARQAARAHDFGFDPGDAVADGYIEGAARALRGAPLRDAEPRR